MSRSTVYNHIMCGTELKLLEKENMIENGYVSILLPNNTIIRFHEKNNLIKSHMI